MKKKQTSVLCNKPNYTTLKCFQTKQNLLEFETTAQCAHMTTHRAYMRTHSKQASGVTTSVYLESH